MKITERTNPKRYFDKKEFWIPEDISGVSSTRLRGMHSYWGENYVFCMSRVSIIEAKLKELRQRRRVIFNNKFILYKERRLANQYAWIQAENHTKVIKFDDKINVLEIQLEIWRSLMDSCKTYKEICSRDQSFREKELDHYFKRGGQGK